MWPVNRPEAVRINALNAAVEFVTSCVGQTPDDVIRTASYFEDYIYNGKKVG